MSVMYAFVVTRIANRMDGLIVGRGLSFYDFQEQLHVYDLSCIFLMSIMNIKYILTY